MQRISSLLSLLLFMLLISWLGHSFQQEPPPPREKKPGADFFNEEYFKAEETELPERLLLPGRGTEEPLEIPPDSGKDSGSLEPALPAGEKRTTLPDELDAIHFLLLGRDPAKTNLDILMVVTLIPGSHAFLTAVDPDLPVSWAEETFPLADFLSRGGGYRELCQVVGEVTGLMPQFYIELNLKGFYEMVELLGGADCEGGSGTALKGKAPGGERQSLDGRETLAYLVDKTIDTGDKEELLINLLVAARDVDHTRLGVKLLWTGFRNIKTNVSLADLLQVRRVTQNISPYRVSLEEIRP